jgi:hypothetical protein
MITALSGTIGEKIVVTRFQRMQMAAHATNAC